MKNKDNGIVLFNGKYESPLWLNPYKIVDDKVVSGEVINGAWSFTKKYLQEPNYYVIVPAEVTGNYNDVIQWAIDYYKGKL